MWWPCGKILVAGSLFVAPIPILTYDFDALKLNALYVPRYGEYNKYAVFGFYLSVPLRSACDR